MKAQNAASSSCQSPKVSLLSSSLARHRMEYKPSETLSVDDTLIEDEAFGNDAALKDQATSYRVFEMELHAAKAKAANVVDAQKVRLQKDLGRIVGQIPQSAPTSVFRRNVSNPEAAGSSNKGKRKVTFNSELAVRTIEPSDGKSRRSSGKRKESATAEEEIFQLDGIDQVEGGPITRPTRSTIKTTSRRRNSPSPPKSLPPFASSYKDSIFTALAPNLPPVIETAPQKSTLRPKSSDDIVPVPHSNALTLEIESDYEDDDNFMPLEDEDYFEARIDLGPSSLPIPTNPHWEALSKPRQSALKLGSMGREEEALTIPEFALASTAPTSRTFQERAEEVLRMASRPDLRPRSQKSIRRKIYEEVDRQRHVDPGPDLIIEEGSDTDSEYTNHDSQFYGSFRR